MKQYKIIYCADCDKPDDVVDEEMMDGIMYELETFERYDVDKIQELDDNGEVKDTIWTQEEGILVDQEG